MNDADKVRNHPVAGGGTRSGSSAGDPDATGLVTRLVDTPLGPMLAAARGDALVELRFIAPDAPVAVEAAASPALDTLERELGAYFRGELRRFSVPLRPEGSLFQLRVWAALLEIPFGETRSYQQLARALGRADAVRAVGSANAENPIAVVVPCHRVIGADGSLTGYAGGLERKRWLLDHEISPRLL